VTEDDRGTKRDDREEKREKSASDWRLDSDRGVSSTNGASASVWVTIPWSRKREEGMGLGASG